MSPEYLAGFFDGEGCVDVQGQYRTLKSGKKFYVRPRIRISQAECAVEVLKELQKEFGGHLVFRKAASSRQQNSYSLEFLSEDSVVGFVNTVIPHLIVKREQALLVMWWLSNAKGLQEHLTTGIEKARMIFKEELSAMKRDPQRLSERAVQQINAALMR